MWLQMINLNQTGKLTLIIRLNCHFTSVFVLYESAVILFKSVVKLIMDLEAGYLNTYLPPLSLCCRCAAEYRGEAGSRETRLPAGAGCHETDRARQGRGQRHHPCDPPRHVQTMNLTV